MMKYTGKPAVTYTAGFSCLSARYGILIKFKRNIIDLSR